MENDSSNRNENQYRMDFFWDMYWIRQFGIDDSKKEKKKS
jgi:hypothetical protein